MLFEIITIGWMAAVLLLPLVTIGRLIAQLIWRLT
jgi:hypothetical protein